MSRLVVARFAIPLLAGLLASACNADDDRSEAERVGLGGGCQVDANCTQRAGDAAEGYDLTCFVDFDGGLCGIDQCDSGADCPEGSACVLHDNGQNHCFRLCSSDDECNVNRNADVPASCTTNAQFLQNEGVEGDSVCIPPAAAR